MKIISFPQVSGKNLERQKLSFPADFAAPFNLILMAFFQHQQLEINTWLPFVDQLDSEGDAFTYYEFPVVYQMGPLRQFMLNEGMRAGIPDQKARAKTITLYLDKAPFLQQLGIESQDQIQILLVRKNGQVIWRESGILTDRKMKALEKALQKGQRPKANEHESDSGAPA